MKLTLSNCYGALVPMDRLVGVLEQETDIKRVADFARACEAAKKIDSQNDERTSYWGEAGIWSMRRLGRLLKEGEKKGTITKHGGDRKSRSRNGMLTLSDLAIDNNHAFRAKALDDLVEKEVRARIEQLRAQSQLITRASLAPLLNQQRTQQRQKTLKEMEWPKGKYRVIYADPAWSYNDKRLSSISGGGASGTYETESTETICARKVPEIALKDSVLFLWVTSPLLPDGLKVMEAWQFQYKASFVWDKCQGFNGHYNDVFHELLLLGVSGSCLPDNTKLFPSVISEHKGKHSEKPEQFRQMIDSMYSLGPRVELYARTKTDGWDCWGNEVQ